MIEIRLSEHGVQEAMNLGHNRSASVNHYDYKPSPNILKAKGFPKWYGHFIGALGETAYSVYSHQDVDKKTLGHGDNGIDFPDGVDVKTSATKYKPNLLLSKSVYARKQASIYVLAWVPFASDQQYNIIRLIGWITQQRFDAEKETKEFEHGESWIIRNHKLQSMEMMKAQA